MSLVDWPTPPGLRLLRPPRRKAYGGCRGRCSTRMMPSSASMRRGRRQSRRCPGAYTGATGCHVGLLHIRHGVFGGGSDAYVSGVMGRSPLTPAAVASISALSCWDHLDTPGPPVTRNADSKEVLRRGSPRGAQERRRRRRCAPPRGRRRKTSRGSRRSPRSRSKRSQGCTATTTQPHLNAGVASRRRNLVRELDESDPIDALGAVLLAALPAKH